MAGAARACILGRCVGGLTGSRVAGALARIPVESCLAARAPLWRKWGFRLGGAGDEGTVLCCATYIDNCFAVSSAPAGAVAILEDLEDTLLTTWQLAIKPSSRSFVESFGGTRGVVDEVRWPNHSSFLVLGHLLQNTGSIRADWAQTRRQMWAAFWANAGSAGSSKLTTHQRMRLLLRGVLPILDFRCSRWPPQATIANELDAMQRKMVATLLRLTPLPDEDAAQFVRRRGRAAHHLCTSNGWWSHRWFRRALAWDAHVRRGHNPMAWSTHLVDFKGATYLAQRRAFHQGRTATRTSSGFVSRRWHDGIAFAREALQ